MGTDVYRRPDCFFGFGFKLTMRPSRQTQNGVPVASASLLADLAARFKAAKDARVSASNWLILTLDRGVAMSGRYRVARMIVLDFITA
jgi:hypothetical protein